MQKELLYETNLYLVALPSGRIYLWNSTLEKREDLFGCDIHGELIGSSEIRKRKACMKIKRQPFWSHCYPGRKLIR